MSLSGAPMTTRQALHVSHKKERDILGETIAKQREQIDAQMKLAAECWRDEDWELFQSAIKNLNGLAPAYRENLEMRSMSRCTVPEATSETLAGELVKRFESGEAGVEKTLADALKRIRQPKRKAGGARGSR